MFTRGNLWLQTEYQQESVIVSHLPHITPHSLRHTFCTNYANAGMNPKALQYIMGHANIAMTLNYYAHATFDSAMAEMKRLNKEKQQERLVA